VCPLRSDGSLEMPDVEEMPARKPQQRATEDAATEVARAATATIDATALAGVKALIVDDEPDALEVLRRQLVECGADVFAVATAEDALKRISQVHPHVLVSDIGMPERDGYWLIQQIRLREVTSGTHLPAIALTAFARPEDRERALDAGYDHHLPKPAEAAELIALVASVAAGPLSGSR
jgi:CheY-like chemotaxis protein